LADRNLPRSLRNRPAPSFHVKLGTVLFPRLQQSPRVRRRVEVEGRHGAVDVRLGDLGFLLEFRVRWPATGRDERVRGALVRHREQMTE